MSNPPTSETSSVFPIAYGNEEETGLMDNISGVRGEMTEPYLLVGHLKDFIPKELLSYTGDPSLFLLNGSKIYPGGSIESERPTNLERATAECASPSQLSLAIRASELLLVRTVENYVRTMSEEYPQPVTARIQRRVVDSRGSRKGCHDNFGLSRETLFTDREFVPDELMEHIASRSFITGAGYVNDSGLEFAQKVGGLSRVSDYSNAGSIMRVTTAEGSPRLEIRSSDINISDWAVRVRIGSTALAIARSQSLIINRPTISEYIAQHNVIEYAKNMNEMPLLKDGTLRPTKYLTTAIDVQQYAAESSMTSLGDYGDVPDELLWAAGEVYEFCDDMRRVMKGEATIALLANRADWAMKMLQIIRHADRAGGSGADEVVPSTMAKFYDLKYDYIGISGEDGVLGDKVVGTGFKLRDRGQFKSAPADQFAVDRLYVSPPPQTRAAVRGRLLKDHEISYCDWAHVGIKKANRVCHVKLPDVDKNYLDKDTQAYIDSMH